MARAELLRKGGNDMIRKHIYGTPFETEAVMTDIAQADSAPAYGVIDTGRLFFYLYHG